MAFGLLGGNYTPPQANVSPEFASYVKQQNQQAQDFRANQPNLQQQQQTQIQENARENLASQMAGIKSGANKRGLLYSGLKSDQERQAGTQAAAGAASQIAGANQAIENQAQTLDNQAVQGGLALQQAQQNADNVNYANEMQNKQAKNNAIAGLLGAVGSIGGSVAGR